MSAFGRGKTRWAALDEIVKNEPKLNAKPVATAAA